MIMIVIVENGIKLYGMDGQNVGVGAHGVGGTAHARRRAALQRVSHTCARHHLSNDRPELTSQYQYLQLEV